MFQIVYKGYKSNQKNYVILYNIVYKVEFYMKIKAILNKNITIKKTTCYYQYSDDHRTGNNHFIYWDCVRGHTMVCRHI
jgi:hypothetical protein